MQGAFCRQKIRVILRFARSDMRECTTVLDRMSDVGKAQNIPQHKAKTIVKFIVPSLLEPLTTPSQKKAKKIPGIVLLDFAK